MTTGLFIETAFDLDSAPDRMKQEAVVVIAITAEAEYECRKRGLNFVPIETLYDEPALNQRGNENFAKIALFSEKLQDAVDSSAIDGKDSFQPYHYNYYLKVVADHLLFAQHMIDSAITRLKLTQIAFRADSPGEWNDDFYYPGRLLPAVGTLVARTRGVTVDSWQAIAPQLPLPAEAKPLPTPPLSRRIRNRLGRTIRLLRQFVSAPHNGWGRTAVIHSAPRGSIIQGFLLAGCKTHPYSSLFVDESSAPEPWKALWESLRLEPWLRQPWIMADVDLSELILPGIKYLLTSLAPRQLAAVAHARTVLQKLKRPFLVSYAPMTLAHRSANIAARQLGIPTFVMQHGGFNAYMRFPMLQFTDLHNSNYYLCWGMGSVEYVRKHYPHVPATTAIPQTKAISSPELLDLHRKAGTLRHRQQHDPLRVLFLIGSLHGFRRYFSNQCPPDQLSARVQIAAIDQLCTDPDVDLMIRPYPWQNRMAVNPLYDHIRDHHYSCQIDCTTPLVEQLKWADVILIDNPTTVMLQAAATAKPIAVLVNPDYVTDEARPLLERRACVAYDEAQFPDAIAKALDQARNPKNDIDNGFLKAFGLSSENDEFSVCRTVLSLLANAAPEAKGV